MMRHLTFFSAMTIALSRNTIRFGITCGWTLFLFWTDIAYSQVSQVGAAQTAVGVNAVTVNKPAGIQVGDFLIATLSYNETSGNIDLDVAPVSSGWTLLQDVNLDNGNGDDEWRGAVFYKVAAASDLTATNYLFDLDDQADGVVGGIIGFTGVDPTMPFDVAPGTINVTNASSVTATSKTTITPNTAIVMLAMVSDNNAISGWTTTSPGGLTEIFDAGTSNGGDSQIGAAWAIKPGTGATGNGIATMGATDQSGGILLVLREDCSNVMPTVPVVLASPNPFCEGQTVTLTITGNLNNADYWAIYTGSCGGTLLGTTTSNTFVVNPIITTTYFVRGEGVCVLDPGLCGMGTAMLDPNPPACTTPVYPSDLAIDIPLSASLEWQSTSCATGYKIYFGSNFPPTNLENGTDLGNVVSYNPANLIPNTTYYWNIVPYNSNGDALGCDTWEFTTSDGTPDCTTPVFPFNGSAGLNPAGVSLTWNAEPDATSYVLYFGTNNPPTNIVNGTNLGNITTYATGPLSPATTYYWRIRPQNSFGNAGMCDVWSFTTDLDGILFCDDCTTPPTDPVCQDPGTDPNPDLMATCAEISIAFVLDESGSVSNNQAQMENGTMNFLSALSCTGASVAMIEFNGYGRFMVEDYTYVDDDFIDAAQSYFDDIPVAFMGNEIYEPGAYPSNDQGTNWHAALLAVDELDYAPDLIIFLTDGVPTGYSTGANPTYDGPFDYCGAGNSTQNPEIVNPIKLTNKFKEEGSHVFVVGVGNVTIASMQEISGTTEFVLGTNTIGNSDYALGSFADLSQGLAEIVSDLCPFSSEVISSDICPNASNGSISISVPNNLLPYNYSYYNNVTNVYLGGANNVNTTPLIISGLPVGSYRIEVEVTLPGSGCTRTEIFFEDITTTAVEVVAAITALTHPTCDDANAGAATLTITAGVAPYTITLRKSGVIQPGYPTITNTNPFIVTGLSFGSYSLEVHDVNNCNLDINPFILNEPTNCCPVICMLTGGPGGNVCPETESSFGVSILDCELPIYNWTLINNTSGASIVGSAESSTVTIHSGTMCGAYTVQSTITCDGCNPVVCTQTVNVVDSTNPVISICAQPRMMEGCNTSAISSPPFSTAWVSTSEDVFESAPNNGLVSDNCDIASVAYIDVAMGTCPVMVTRTWSVTDVCGNTATCVQTITVDDNTLPVISQCAVTRTIEGCGTDAIWGPVFSAITVTSSEAEYENETNQGMASDECEIISVSYFDVAMGNCPTIVTRTWTISDACNNTSSCIQTIYVDDTVAPVFEDCPSNPVSLGCNPQTVTEALAISDAGTATDACGVTEYTATEGTISNVGCHYSQVWTVMAVDACSNQSLCFATYTWTIDTVGPVLTCPTTDLYLGCNPVDNNEDGIPDVIVTSVPWTDNCDGDGLTDVYVDSAIDLSGCEQSLTRTFAYTDACGQTGSCAVTYTWMADTTDPMLQCPVTGLDLGCSPEDNNNDGLPDAILSSVPWTDNCDGAGSTSIYTDTQVDMTGCDRSITRTFMYTDQCDNTGSCSVTYTWIVDTEPPVITSCPAGGDLGCNPSVFPLPNVSDVLFTDNCSTMAVVSAETTYHDTIGCTGTMIFRYIVKDACNNQDTCFQTYVYTVDNAPPVITVCPALTEVECPVTPVFGTPQAQDNCDPSPLMSISSTVTTASGICSSEYSVTRTWVFKDACGNISEPCMQTITVKDDTAPVITFCPSDIMINCDVNPTFGTPTATDACDPSPEMSVSSTVTIPGSCSQEYSLTRTWIFRDACGNESASCAQTITVTDNTAPVIVFCPSDVTVECPTVPVFGSPIASDACDPSPMMSISSTVTSPGACPQEYSVTRTWIFRDACGNESVSCSQTIAVVDHTAPVIVFCPSNQEVECTGTLPSFGTPQAVDICDPTPVLSVSSTVTTPGDCPQEYSVTRTWIFTDACGNESVPCSQTIMVTDQAAPVITFCPPNALIECPSTPVFGIPTASDACDPAPVMSISSTVTLPGSCAQEYSVTRTWVFTDACGNRSQSCLQTITVIDTIAPVVEYCPPDDTIDCSATPVFGTPLAFDACDPSVLLSISSTVTTPGVCAQTYSITRTWVFKDACNNVSFPCTQTIFVTDNAAPVLVFCPPNTMIECPATPVFGMPVASDACDPSPVMSISSTVTLSGMCPQEYNVTRTWVFKDACGNRSEPCSQTITVSDQTAPVIISCPSDESVECPAIPVFGTPTATDQCDVAPLISVSSTVTTLGTCPQEYSITRTWVFKDLCGNVSLPCSQTIHVTDNTPPVITFCPPNQTIECPGMPIWGIPMATDACDPTPISSTSSLVIIPGSCPQEYSIMRTWVFRDDCGNTSMPCSQTITVIDTTAPVISFCPPDQVIECPAIPEFGIPMATDACDANPLMSVSSTVTTPGACPMAYSLTRTWVFRDACGNKSSSCSQTISVVDSTGPVVTFCPENTSISCPATPVFGTPTAMDGCDPSPVMSVSSTVTIPGTCPQEYSMTRTWIFRDVCGNVSASCSQTIFITDETAPVITFCPANSMVECPATPEFGIPTATDICDPFPVISISSTVSSPGSCPQEYSMTRTWVFKDACGNVSTSCAQTITVTDTIAPVITFCPPNQTIECPATPVWGIPVATDGCDPTPMSSTSSLVIIPGNCPLEYSIMRTWVFRDDCGNKSIPCTQTITVIDTTAPVITFCPPEQTITCPATPEFGIPTATDACDPNPVISVSSTVTTPGSCPQKFSQTRTWVFRDACGHVSTSCSQTIFVTDNTAPVISFCPPNKVIECPALPVFGTPTAIDACDPNPVMMVMSTVTTFGACPEVYSLTRTWVFKDACGNVSPPCQQTITVKDTQKPVITFCPPDMTISCPAIPVFGMPTATDACDFSPQISISSTLTTPGNCPQEYNVTRTWVFKDPCGNVSLPCQQTITVVDSTSPVIACPFIPNDTIDCPEVPVFPTATATDACDANLVLSFSDVTEPGNCANAYSITRTWTATDHCGNSASCSRTIWVQDFTPPLLACPVDTVVDCHSLTLPAFTGIGVATDVCDNDPVMTYSDVWTEGNCQYENSIERTWYATDHCGNVSSCIQTIFIQDTIAPSMFCPNDTLVDCHTQTLPAFTGMATATDLCDVQVSLTYSDLLLEGPCLRAFVILRTWQAADACGNMTSCMQTIMVQDTTPPVFDCPMDTIMDCHSNTHPDVTGHAQAEDLCDPEVELYYTDITDPGTCPYQYTIVRTWTAIDDCDNSAQCVQIIDIQDTIPPFLYCATDTVIDCHTSSLPSNTGIPIVEDLCDASPELTYSDLLLEGNCFDAFIILRTWMVEDICGNMRTCTQTIWVQDTTSPLLICPRDTIVDCSTTTSPGILGMAEASDLCDLDLELDFQDEIIPGSCPFNFTILRVWTAIDNCDNISSCIQTIIVQDTLAPALVGPLDTVVNCHTSLLPEFTGIAMAEDLCGPAPELTYSDLDIEGSCVNSYIILRTWFAEDMCGNFSSYEQTILVQDTTAPVLICPVLPNLFVQCPEEADFGMAQAEDACDPEVLIESQTDMIPGECPNDFTLMRTWTAYDNCGNSTTCSASITVLDTVPPVCVVEDVSLDTVLDPAIGYVVLLPEMFDEGSYDLCGGITRMVSPDTLYCEDEGDVSVTFTVTDLCGNMSTCEVLISLNCIDPDVDLNVWMHLEGAASDPNGFPTYSLPMRTSLNDLRILPGQCFQDPFLGLKYSPPGQPYQGAPWFYQGTEGEMFDSEGIPSMGDAGYPPTVVDWVLVSVRALPTDLASSPVCIGAGLLHNNGWIEFVQDMDCSGLALDSGYYLVVEHRNHLIAMSHSAIEVQYDQDSTFINYDYRFQQSYIDDPFMFGFFTGQKEILPGKFAAVSGNGQQVISQNSDTDINFDDRTFWEDQNGFPGEYRIGDYNLNGDTNFNDRVTWERNNGRFTSVPRD